MAITQSRTGAKATPEAVFAACDHLRKTHESGEFRNEEVLAITGGGMSTVARLVKLYRAYQPVVDANKALDSKTSIELVMAIDTLIQKQISQADAHLTRFYKTAGLELTEMGKELEKTVQELDEERQEKNALQAELTDLHETLKDARQASTQLDRERVDARSQCHALQDELKHNEKMYEQKLERQTAQHHQALTAALEAQRKSTEEEKQAHLDRLQLIHKGELKEAQTRTDLLINQREASIATLLAQNNSLKGELDMAQLEQRRKAGQLQASEQRLEAVIAEKQVAVDEAQRINRQLLSAFQDHVSANSDDVADRLSDIVNKLGDALTEISTKLKGVQEKT